MCTCMLLVVREEKNHAESELNSRKYCHLGVGSTTDQTPPIKLAVVIPKKWTKTGNKVAVFFTAFLVVPRMWQKSGTYMAAVLAFF